ncbi:MAG: HNH endonuclease [Sphingomonadaceae bacterium]
MAHAVFVYRRDSIYDDLPSEHYQFPRQYLKTVRQAEGDWIVYYEPTKVPDARGYFAVAKVAQVLPDPHWPHHWRALIAPGEYLDFASPVPLRLPDGPAERARVRPDGSFGGGAMQSAVRSLAPSDYARILKHGLADVPEAPQDAPPLSSQPLAVAEAPLVWEVERPVKEMLVNRPLRDAQFRRAVLAAYGNRCALTGLQFVNGGGAAEVQAAHIRPVEHGGPDAIGNGLALSATVHWMFDRGLVGLSDRLDILVSPKVNDVEGLRRLLLPDRRALRPCDERLRPHPAFLAWHRRHHGLDALA